jgi:peptidoglycan/LPS O-acetylase OafA/YrhL
MKLKSKRTFLALLVGVIIGVLITFFITPRSLGTIIGVAIGAYLAKVKSPKQGAIFGAIILIPIGIFLCIIANMQTKTIESLGWLKTIPYLLLVVAILSGIGALYGLLIGKIFQVINRGKLII